MNEKPKESDWIAFLYNELEGEERVRVEQYLVEHPEMQLELDEMAKVLGVFRKLEDKEVIAPTVVEERRIFLRPPLVRMVIGIAASLVILLLVGKLTSFHAGVQNGMVVMGFGDPKISQPATLTQQEVDHRIQEAIEKSNVQVGHELTTVEQTLTATFSEQMKKQSASLNRIEKMVKAPGTQMEERLAQYASFLQEQNSKSLSNFMQLSAEGQQQYLEATLTDYTKYIQQQRASDWEVLQVQLENIAKQNAETRQVLGDVISSSVYVEGLDSRN